MNCEKYIGLDVHQATIAVAVRDCKGKVVMESILETKASTILEFFAGLRGTLSVTLEEGTWAAWLYDLLKPHVARVVVLILARTLCSNTGTKMTVSMLASWPTCYASMIWSPSTTVRRVCVRCVNWHGVI